MLALVLATAAMFALGLLIAARPTTPAAAGVFGSLALYPMLFFAGPSGSRRRDWRTVT